MSKQQQKQEPWEALPDVWKSRAAYFSWLRGILRRGWNRHPAKIKLLNRKRYMIKNPNPKGRRAEVWGLKCECCGTEAPMKEFEVDHIIAAGSLNSWEDVAGFVHRLLGHCSEDDLRILCKKCHQVYSYCERTGMSFEDAVIEKQLIALKKLKMDELIGIVISYGLPTKGLKKAQLIDQMRTKLQNERLDNVNQQNHNHDSSV